MPPPILKAERLVGSGAAGTVYEASETSGASQRRFALKVLKDLSPVAVANFEREVLILSKLRHPGLVALHGFSKNGDGVSGLAPEDRGPCYWMDFIEGASLESAPKGADADRVQTWFRQALEALDFIHGEGILHGDLKPANILIDAEGTARLVDFGLASLTSEGSDAKLRGSLPYLAPESLRGERSPASDLYALGVVFYEILAGHHPRAGAANLAALFAPEFPHLEDKNLAAPERFRRIVDRMIESDLAVRFKNARDALSALSGSDLPGRSAVSEPFQMTGRHREWAEALNFVNERGGRGGLILVRGLTGTGKTRFARELYFQISLEGYPAERAGDRDELPEAARRDLHARLRAPEGFLILEINDDRLDPAGASFVDALASEDGVLSLTLSPEGFQDTARLAGSAETLKKRLEKISTEERRLLEALAVEDEGASLSSLARVADLKPIQASDAVRRLGALGLVRSRGDDSVALAHAILAPLVLDSLSPEAKRSLDRRWIEETVPSGDVLRAAEGLEQRGEFRRSVRLYRRALGLAEDPVLRDALLRGLANVLGAEGNFRAALRVLEEWHREFPSDPKGLNAVKYALASGVAYKNLGDRPRARELFETCLRAGRAEDPDHRPRLARAQALLGELDLAEDRFEDAAGRFAAARALLLDPSAQKAEVFLNEARLAASPENPNARWDRALQALDDSEAVAVQIGSRPAQFAAVLERGNLAMMRERFEDAQAAYDRALELASDPPDEALKGRVLQNLGVLDERRRRPAEALAHLTEARRLLLFFGNPFERAMNLLQLALARASVGRFAEARDLLKETYLPPDSLETAARCEEVLRGLRDLETGETGLAADELRAMHAALPDALKITFEDRPDYQRLVKRKALKTTTTTKETSMDALHQLNAILRDLLTSDDVDAIMSRILDGAVEIAKARRGFLVTSDEAVKASKNLSKDFLKGDGFRLSLSAVREAIKTGEPVVTDNASLDPRFKSAASVQELELKSICVLPLKAHEGVIGVLYLDHPYQAQIFQGADLNLLKLFADQAALALQKARTIEGMKDEIVNLKKEVEEQRLQLTHEYAEIVGQSRPMMEVLSLVDRLVDTSIPVWIYGESGTGKEAIARALHFKGPRAKKPFVSENCSSLPETLLESELFGHKKGSFTHADRDKKGLLHHADGGTVFLDEIADMSPTLQAKLLRFLQEGEIRPVGSNEVLKVDVRVVSASNKDLNLLVADGKFREDLFYRLNGMTVALPPLRERVEDIPLLVQHFLKRLAAAEKKEALEITPEALDLLTDYAWPGNVRELENTIRSASLFHYKGKLLPKSFHFKKTLVGGSLPSSPPSSPSAGPRKDKGGATDEKTLLLNALKKTNFHKGEAAEELGISRRYLYTQMAKFGIPIKRMQMKAFVEKALS
ncbi:MAG TPA: sigma 54-interacting transcriptional regulator [bacterium]|nr:sigma 54-interacting transcriptional regulator [bacterium]